jgi:hypothetical protein
MKTLMEYKLSKKAWEINFSEIKEGFYYTREVVYAENRNKAKSALFKRFQYAPLQDNYSDKYFTYLNFPVVRNKEFDKYIFEDKELTIDSIDRILMERARILTLDKMLNDNSIQYCYIKKGSYYRPNSGGYTDFISKAGVYTKEKAVSYAKSCRDLKIIPIDIKNHNDIINQEIEELKTRLIIK